ncbi:MAG: DUF3368 domain-containing protein [Deltaproteobacteria bacterium]|nr:DUF3368 domain-containing protein [Deltaproteobacteria bacterium]
MPEDLESFFLDSVVLSNFALADALPLLVDRYGARAVLTSEVLDELADGISHGYEKLRGIVNLVIDNELSTTCLTEDERVGYIELLSNLGSGEASCIVCARSRGGVVVTDDKVARKSCLQHRVRFTGTLGILRSCCVEGALTDEEADKILEEMIHRGFYSPINRLSDLL